MMGGGQQFNPLLVDPIRGARGGMMGGGQQYNPMLTGQAAGMAAAPATTQTAAGGQAASPATINTSIQPQGVFPNSWIQAQGNLAAALATPAQTDLMAGRQMTGFGMNSPAIQQGAGIDWGRAMAQAQMAPQQVAQTANFANLQNILAGQSGREQEALGWGNLLGQQQQYQNQLGQMQMGSLLSMLQGQQPWYTY